MASSEKVRVSVFMARSLDGFIAREDGDVGWLDEVEPLTDGDDMGYGAFFGSIDVLVLGRNSFEKVLTFGDWPYGDKPVVVMSRSLQTVPEHLEGIVRIMSDTPQGLLNNLAAQGVERIYLDGGRLIQSFLQEGLVDDMVLTTIPVILGRGIPLFGELDRDIRLTHVKTQTWDNGLVQSTYEVASENK